MNLLHKRIINKGNGYRYLITDVHKNKVQVYRWTKVWMDLEILVNNFTNLDGSKIIY